MNGIDGANGNGMLELIYGVAFFGLLAGLGILWAIALKRLPPVPANRTLRTISLYWALALGLLVVAHSLFP